MRTLIDRHALTKLLGLLLSALLAFQPAAFAQGYARPAFTQRELDQMLAPIALYPDQLLSQVLMASTYPLEVVEAARWSRAHRGLRGDGAVRAAADRDWDPGVKSLVAFPQILAMMDQKPEWTERLGDAFLAQEPQVMDTVQALRQRAYSAGNLRSNDQYRVAPEGGVIAIKPTSPQVVYVPYYDPLLIYGPWWWPAYPPVYWAPWPGYYVRPGFAWGTGIGVSVGFFFGTFDWHRHHARVVNVNNYYYSNRTVIVNRQPNIMSTNVTRNVNAVPGAWQHDPAHRRGAPYRLAPLNEKFVGAAAADRRELPAPPAAAAGQNARPEKPRSRPDARGNAGRVDPPAFSRPNPPPTRSGVEQQHRVPAPPPQAIAPAPPQPAPAKPANLRAQQAEGKGRGEPHSGKPHDDSDRPHEKK